MPFFEVKDIRISGVAACVPKNVEENILYPYFNDGEAERVIATTGIERRRISPINVTSSDLCYEAADQLVNKLDWNRSDIGCLIYVSQTPDYILPATSCILQQRLGLSVNCLVLDISIGCPGWIYGMNVISSLMAHGKISKGLLLVGETPSKYKSYKDKTSWPLFGDAGTATALEFDVHTHPLQFFIAADGYAHETIMFQDGGFRNPFSRDSLLEVMDSDGIFRNSLQSKMDGMSVFSFAIKQGPLAIKELVSHFSLNIDFIDYLFIHQANLYMNEKIRKKIGFSRDKVPYSLRDFGNTSCATIPLTMVVGDSNAKLKKSHSNNIACAFGVGLTWGSVYFETDALDILDLIEI